ncbi:T-cell activation Rho GTPase-activating protein-like [Pezoporus occidentalis]|uniref:T-cell activation Rho GTPase-activating protein-like n=1 Tax=Pezoporus occidentalis TaxID=407982 RepID=UPI002F909C32
MGLPLPFLQDTSIPVTLRQEGAEHWGPSLPNDAASLVPSVRGDSTGGVWERSPGASPPRLFALFPLAAGGTSRSKRKLPWPFAWLGTRAAAEAPGPSGSAVAGALFGRPLADLCNQDGMLPQPIQDLLALLKEHGPSTEGIFRLAVSQRACREVRDALDSGVPVQLENQPVLLLAVLLKDLLRNIPSKLLDTQLFQEWMHAMEKTCRQERLAALKEVASKLPGANLLLLRHLLSLLSSISRNVATTKMTAGNLAICLAPNLLSPPQELPLDVLALETGKVTKLVEFLIDHHEELLGEQVAGLASKGVEETPAPQAELETAEVPPIAPESEQQRSLSGEKRFPGSLRNTRKRRAIWEEGNDGPRCRKKSKTELSGMAN